MCWMTALHRTKSKEGVRIADGLAEVGDGHPLCDLRVKPARLPDVLLYGVDTVDVVALLPVEEDVAGASPTAGIQPPGPGEEQLLEPVHQVRIAFESRMRGLEIYGLNEAVAHLGVTLGVAPVEALGKIGSLIHCCNATPNGLEAQAPMISMNCPATSSGT